MAACKTLTAYTRQCAKNVAAGINADVYAIAYDDLTAIAGSTEKFTESAAGLVTAIGGTPQTVKFIKIGTVLNQGSITESLAVNDNGTFDVTKSLIVSLNGVGVVDSRLFIESTLGQQIAFLVKLKSGVWVALGLNGQFGLGGSEGTVDASSNGRVVTFKGQDAVLIQTVDPTIIAGLITA